MIIKHTCKNGLRIVTEHIPTVRSVAIGVWIGTGSRNEHEGNNGISHFLEHMFFKGTKTRSAREIAESFDRIGGQVNAFTSKEYTCYYAKVLDTHSDYALEVLADMFFNSTFDEVELEKEKNVVYEEIKMYEDTPDDIVHDLLSRACYGNHPLGYPILGTENILKTFNGDTLRQYIEQYYNPERVVVSVAGNISDGLIKKVEAFFGDYTSNGVDETFETPKVKQTNIFRKKDTEQAHVCLGYNGLSVGDDNIYSLVTLNNILGGSMSSRLFQEVREQRGLAYSVFSYHSSYIDSGLTTIYSGTGKEQIHVLLETIQQTVDELKANGITEKELENSKEQLKGSLMLGLESTNSRMSRNGKNELLLGYHRTLDEVLERINAVSMDSVNNVGAYVFKNEPSLAIVAPEDVK